jgi:hypothetical protein
MKFDVGRNPFSEGKHLGLQVETVETGRGGDVVAKTCEPDTRDLLVL